MIKKAILMMGIFLGTVCFGLIFVFIFVNATEIECVRDDGGAYFCQSETLLLGQVPISEKQFESVVGITVVEDDCFEGCSYRAEFVTADGRRQALSEVWTERSVASRPVDVIGPQMDQSAATINYTIEPFWWVLWLVGGLMMMVLLIGVGVVLRR